MQDCPDGFTEKISMLKSEGALCKRCFYIKRASLGNMKLSELVQNIENNESFADKPHAQDSSRGSWRGLHA